MTRTMIRSTLCLALLLQNTVAFSGPSRHSSLSYLHERRTRVLHAISSRKGKTTSDRFDRTASTQEETDQPCLLEIHGKVYNITAWAKAHPGGETVLRMFHGRNATLAFDTAGHSQKAYDMLREFEVAEVDDGRETMSDFQNKETEASSLTAMATKKKPRWRAKLFTKEDPVGIHKYAGIFVLLHYAFRYFQMYFGDISAGFGTRVGRGASITAPLCLIPHFMLSMSSLIFHTVPRERVVGRPMIWQEFRVHNIAFALRSALASFLAWLSVAKDHAPAWRRFCVITSALSILVTNIVADQATFRLRSNEDESTTATMPYWEGCSVQTQRRFKHFYAYCQFLATMACLAVWNPCWGLAVMLPIQLASLLMTLVRKGLLSARGYHIAYTISLCMPFLVGIRSIGYQFLPFLVLGWLLYSLRRQGVDKYALWTPLVVLRITLGDHFIDYRHW